MECTKLYPKMHVMYMGSMFGVLILHHPETAKCYFGTGNVYHCKYIHIHCCMCVPVHTCVSV